MKLTPPYTPELLAEAVTAFEKLLRSDSRVLEFGSGYSTPWIAGRCAVLVSVEHSQEWYDAVGDALDDPGVPLPGELHERAMLTRRIEQPGDFPSVAERYPDEFFDIVYVDCIDDQRMPCLRASIPKLKHGGVLILDDSHWSMLRPAFDLLAGWRTTAVGGRHVRHDGEEHFHQTTFFEKP